MNRLFKNTTGLGAYGQESLPHFPVQLVEDQDCVLVRALAPGMKQKDLVVVLSGKILSISGRIPCRSGRFLRQEAPCGVFRRDVDLGCLVDGSSVKAALKAGVLTITLLKHRRQRPRRISVQYGA